MTCTIKISLLLINVELELLWEHLRDVIPIKIMNYPSNGQMAYLKLIVITSYA